MKTPFKHVAIIMDGNGRWATKQGKKRTFGHEEGAKRVKEITKAAAKMGIEYITLYAFSTENWNRPKTEVSFLMKLLAKFLDSELDTFLENNIKFRVIGDVSRFSKTLQKSIQNIKEKTSHCTGCTQVIAINYGSKDEIVRAAKSSKMTKETLVEDDLMEYLDTQGMPSVDLLIRTGGDKRISNYLLLQAEHAKLCFIDTLWPDFKEDKFQKLLKENL